LPSDSARTAYAQRVYLVCSLWPQSGLDGAAFVHGPVALGGLVERQGQVEDLAGLDLAVADQVDELGQEAAYRGGPAAHADVGVQQLLAGQLDTVGHADDADEAAGSGRAQGLGHRLAGADALQHGVGADSVRPIAATMQDRPLTAAAAPAADVAGTRGSEARLHGSRLAVERRSVAAMAQVTTAANQERSSTAWD
jgi:hypothetical protein